MSRLVTTIAVVLLLAGCRPRGPLESRMVDSENPVAVQAARACDEADWAACLRLGRLIASGAAGGAVAWSEPLVLACRAGLPEACAFVADRWRDGEGSGDETGVIAENELYRRCHGDAPETCGQLLSLYESGRVRWPESRRGTPLDMVLAACRRGAQSACEAVVPGRAGLYFRRDGDWVTVPAIRETDFDGLMVLFLPDGPWDSVVRNVDRDQALVLVSDAAQPARIETLIQRAERGYFDGVTARVPARFLRDRTDCLALTPLGEFAFEMELQCPPGEYFIHLVHAFGVEDRFFAVRVTTGEQVDRARSEASHCGHPDFDPPAIGERAWRSHSCLSEAQAGENWPRCLARIAYSPTPGAGCPGSERCCPAD